MTPKSIVLAAIALSLSIAGGAQTKRSKVEPAPPPAPYTGAYQPRGVDEIGMWQVSDEDERKLANSRLVIRDASLNAYVRQILCMTVGIDRCGPVRIYIVRAPLFNASMTPNGTMTVFTGLLLRATNEAELGSVLGHEFGHFEKRHTLERFKAHRKGTDLLSWAAVLASMAGTRQAGQTFDDLQTSVYGGLARFNRENEREADLTGLGYLNASGLRPGAASRIWRNFILEVEASSAARGLRKPDFNRTAFFASHPPEGERVSYLYALAAPDGETREDGGLRYASALAPWMARFLDDQIALNDFGASEFLINRLGENGWTAELWRARADLFRGRGNPRDLMNAADFYAKALALNPDMAIARRGLGLSLIKTGREREGRVQLERYLALNPQASDAAMIRMTISATGDRP